MAQDSKTAQGFADRLVAAMKAKGMTSNRTRSGVDVNALAKAVGVSYEMARRYVEGKANPKPDVVSQLAQWLGMRSSELLYGESGASADVNLTALERCVLAVTQAQQSSGFVLSPDESAKVVAQLYAEAVRGNGPSVSTLTALIKAIGKRL